MPEGPEVSIITDQLNSILSGKYVQRINIISGPYLTNASAQFVQTRKRIQQLTAAISKPSVALKVDSIGKKGKFMYFKLSRSNLSVGQIRTRTGIVFGSSLGLTGQWCLSDDSYHKIEIVFSDKPKSKDTTSLWYLDKLSNGRFYVDTDSWLDTKLSEIGVDILSKDFTQEAFDTVCASTKPIYRAITEQSSISGIGNYLRSEIIGNSKLDPFMKMSDLTSPQRKTLYASIKTISTECYKHGSDYRDIFGAAGTYTFKYYKQSVDPYGNAIKTIKDSEGRKFYYC